MNSNLMVFSIKIKEKQLQTRFVQEYNQFIMAAYIWLKIG